MSFNFNFYVSVENTEMVYTRHFITRYGNLFILIHKIFIDIVVDVIGRKLETK